MRFVALISLLFTLNACSKSELTPREVQAVQKTNAVIPAAEAEAATDKEVKASPEAKGDEKALLQAKGEVKTSPEAKGEEKAEVAPKPAPALKLDGTSYGSGVTLPESITIAE